MEPLDLRRIAHWLCHHYVRKPDKLKRHYIENMRASLNTYMQTKTNTKRYCLTRDHMDSYHSSDIATPSKQYMLGVE